MTEEKKPKEDGIQFSAQFKGERHYHLWGYELWIENNEKYCNKLLILNEGFESSWHYHERKDETFIVLGGQVSLTYTNGKNAPEQILVLNQGDKFRLRPGVIHTFKSMVPRSIVMEVSTTDDGDNVKLRAARKIDESD